MKTTVVNSNIHVNNVFFPGDVVEVVNYSSTYCGIEIGERYKVKALKIKPNLNNGQREIFCQLDLGNSEEVCIHPISLILYKRPVINWLKYFLVKLKGKHTLVEVQKESEIKFLTRHRHIEEEYFDLNQNPQGKIITREEYQNIYDKIRKTYTEWRMVSEPLQLEYQPSNWAKIYSRLFDYTVQNGLLNGDTTLYIMYYKTNNKTHKEVYYVKPN